MSDSDSSSDKKPLDFSLPDTGKPTTKKGGGGFTALLLFVIAAAVVANLIVTLLRKPEASGTPSAGDEASELSADSLQRLALKMEKQALHSAATDAWEHYLRSASLSNEEAAKIWYRIGKIHQDGEKHEAALAAFYRSESLHKGSDLADDIGRRAQESLEALGKFAALKHELAERVSLDENSAKEGDDIVAEIGAQKISRAELDQQIEANIENQLARFAAQLPEEDRKRQKEAMLKQLSSDAQRLQFLQGYIVQEILYRKAREMKITEDPKVRAQIRDVERGLLADQMMAGELEGKINITDGDLRTYYDANKAQYVEPESAKISHILIADEAQAAELHGQAGDTDAQGFAELAKAHSADAATKESGGEIAAPVAKGAAFVSGIGKAPALVKAVFETEAGKIAPEPLVTEKGHHLVFVRERTPERQRSFDEARREVYEALRTRKEREVQQNLMTDLMAEYNVVIHRSKFKSATDGEEEDK